MHSTPWQVTLHGHGHGHTGMRVCYKQYVVYSLLSNSDLSPSCTNRLHSTGACCNTRPACTASALIYYSKVPPQVGCDSDLHQQTVYGDFALFLPSKVFAAFPDETQSLAAAPLARWRTPESCLACKIVERSTQTWLLCRTLLLQPQWCTTTRPHDVCKQRV